MHQLKRNALLIAVAAFVAVGCASSQYRPAYESQPLPNTGWVPKVDTFVIVFDDSLSMADRYNRAIKRKIAAAAAESMNQTIPELGYKAGVRTFGQGKCVAEGKTALLTGMAPYSTSAVSGVLTQVNCANGRSPLDLALNATGEDLAGGAGKAAVVIFSDGRHMGQGEVDAAKALKSRYGDRVCIWGVLIGDSHAGRNTLENVVSEGGCGKMVDAESLTTGAAMAGFVEDVLLYKDSDGDGVPDHLDECPETPKGVKVDDKGCPLDTDGDGVPDYLDKCPNTARGVKVDAKGCPLDADGDGVPDHLDKCPGTPKGVKVDAKGCPLDTDGDGVPDHLDKCPGTPRGVPVDERGCPLEGITVMGDEWTVRGKILFDTNKADLKAEAKPLLDKVVVFLKKNAQYTVEIQGHTDSTGGLTWNQELSRRRASSVKAYLVAHGVPDGRLSTRGFGPSDPIGDNATAAGRAENRRVDFKPSEK